jgi:putative Ca2+/H+ antiporter (TMEM165/GDT1 family)
VAGLAVIGGQSILRFVNIKALRTITAVALIALAGWSGWQALR